MKNLLECNIIKTDPKHTNRGGCFVFMSEVCNVDVASIIEGLPTRAAKIRALAEHGLSKKEIAEVLECTPQQVYSALRRRGGGRTRTVEPIELTEEQQAALASFNTNAAKARYLFSQGYSINQIAKTLGIQYQQVYRAVKGNKKSEAEEV